MKLDFRTIIKDLICYKFSSEISKINLNFKF